MPDPIELEVFKNLFHSIAEEMGAALRRTAFSPNIKERRDYSCAVFDSQGQVIAMGDHMPVHLGSMPMSVAAAIETCQREPASAGDGFGTIGGFEPGDVVMLNDPFRGGTHLPDITLVMPVYIEWSDGRLARPDKAKPHRHLEIQKSVILSAAVDVRSASTAEPKDPYLLNVASAGAKARSRKSLTATPDFFVASRAHHADVGGTYPGSMGPCREIYQEGLRIPPVKIMRGGKIVPDALALLLNNVRTPEEREGDVGAQIAACQTGAQRLAELCARYGLARTQKAAAGLLDYAEQLMRSFLATIPPGEYHAEDFLDDDGVDNNPVRIAVAVRVAQTVGKGSSNHPERSTPIRGADRRAESKLRRCAASEPRAEIASEAEGACLSSNQRVKTAVTLDFTGSDPQVAGAVNAVEAITYSACFYVFRCLLQEDVPATAGLMRPIRVIAPLGTVVNARPPAAVAGGNVETSQRIVDVLLRALAKAIPDRIPAAAAGTMNNLTIGGVDHRGTDLVEEFHDESVRRQAVLKGRGFEPRRSSALSKAPSGAEASVTAQPFAYYETIAGGMGARPTKHGVSGVHTHMTNSLNTPVEALESAYPLRVRQYSLRPNSGGRGLHTGGDGIVREIEVLTDAQVTLLADRRTRGPYGLAGGADGAPGRTVIIRNAQDIIRNATWSDGRLARQRETQWSDGRPRPSEEELPGKTSVRLRAGDRIRIESPGGGGWGKAKQ